MPISSATSCSVYPCRLMHSLTLLGYGFGDSLSFGSCMVFSFTSRGIQHFYTFHARSPFCLTWFRSRLSWSSQIVTECFFINNPVSPKLTRSNGMCASKPCYITRCHVIFLGCCHC